MPTSLATWFHDWIARRDMTFKLPTSMKHPRAYTNPAMTCIACGKRRISQGKSQSGTYARKARNCITCYHGDG